MTDEQHALTDKIALAVWRRVVREVHPGCEDDDPMGCSLYEEIWEDVREVVAFPEVSR